MYGDESDQEDEVDVIEGIFRFVPCEGILTDGVCKFKFEVTRPGEKYFSPMNAVFYKTIGEFGFVSALLEYRITGNITKTGDTFIVQSCTPISARRYESFILYDMLDTGNYLHEQEKDAIVQNGYDIPTMERLHKVHMPEIHRKEGRVYYNFDIYNTLYKMTNDQSVFTLNLDDTRKAVDWIKGNPFKSCLHFSIGGKNYTCKPENVQSTIGVEFTELEIDAIKSYIDASSDGGRLPLGSNKDVVSVLEKAGYVVDHHGMLYTTSYTDCTKRYLDWLRSNMSTSSLGVMSLGTIRPDLLSPNQQGVLSLGDETLFQVVGASCTGKTHIGKIIAGMEPSSVVVVSKTMNTVDEYEYSGLTAYHISVAEFIVWDRVNTLILEDAHRFTVREVVEQIKPSVKLSRIIFIGDDNVGLCDDRGETLIQKNKNVHIVTYKLKHETTNKKLLSSEYYRHVDLGSVSTVRYQREAVYLYDTENLKDAVSGIYSKLDEKDLNNVLWLVERESDVQAVSYRVKKYLKRTNEFCVGDKVRYKLGHHGRDVLTATAVSYSRVRTIYGLQKPEMVVVDVKGERKKVPPTRMMSGICMSVADFLQNTQTHRIVVLFKVSGVEKLVYRVSLQTEKAIVVV